jgi:hydrogenase expression/formation protein HypC
MQICEINGFVATCEAKGVFRDVSLFMLQDEPLEVDDFVVVHVGYAIQKITPQEAQTAWELYDQMIAADQADMNPTASNKEPTFFGADDV